MSAHRLAAPAPAEVREVLAPYRSPATVAESMRTLAISILPLAVVGAVGTLLPAGRVWWPLWSAYFVVAGTAAVSLWVLGHECGHEAFARHRRVNRVVGLIAHSLCLVPFSVWARSHRRHHATTNHVERGEVFAPPVDRSAGERSRPGAVWRICTDLIAGWPAHILFGATRGPSAARRRLVRSDASSLVGLGVVVCVLVTSVASYGVRAAVLYVGPYVVMNAWVVFYTRLHHTDVGVEHLADPDWSFVAGAFLTVDRPYPRFIDWLHHRIGSTHVAHHLDASLSYRRAAKATQVIAARWPDLYRADSTPLMAAAFRSWRFCTAVAPSGESAGLRFPSPTKGTS